MMQEHLHLTLHVFEQGYGVVPAQAPWGGDPSVGLHYHGHVRGYCDDFNQSTFYSLTC